VRLWDRSLALKTKIRKVNKKAKNTQISERKINNIFFKNSQGLAWWFTPGIPNIWKVMIRDHGSR
jgi:hypothetical protein